MKREEMPVILSLLLIGIAVYYFWRAVELTARDKPYFVSALIALTIGSLLLLTSIRIIERVYKCDIQET